MKILQAEIENLTGQSLSEGDDEQALMPPANDIEFLRAEISLLRSFSEEDRNSVASLNDIGLGSGFAFRLKTVNTVWKGQPDR